MELLFVNEREGLACRWETASVDELWRNNLTTKGSPGWDISSFPSGFGALGSVEGAAQGQETGKCEYKDAMGLLYRLRIFKYNKIFLSLSWIFYFLNWQWWIFTSFSLLFSRKVSFNHALSCLHQWRHGYFYSIQQPTLFSETWLHLPRYLNISKNRYRVLEKKQLYLTSWMSWNTNVELIKTKVKWAETLLARQQKKCNLSIKQTAQWKT